MEKEVNTYQQFNFQIALDKIETLTQHNNELLDRVDKLEDELRENNKKLGNHTIEYNDRFNDLSKDAENAMNRYKKYLKKEFPNAKSKQSKGQPV